MIQYFVHGSDFKIQDLAACDVNRGGRFFIFSFNLKDPNHSDNYDGMSIYPCVVVSLQKRR